MNSDRMVDQEVADILDRLRTLGSAENVAGMKRYGVGGRLAFGVQAPDMRGLAREIGVRHDLALRLWETGWREARLVAAMTSDPDALTEAQMEAWVYDFESWDVCDGVCNELFRRSRLARSKALAWSADDAPFVKRAGFVLMAQLAVHDKDSGDEPFLEFLPVIERQSTDPRPIVAKGINWALRQIGKRNHTLRLAAIASAQRIRARPEGRACWIASDAIRELHSEAVIRRLDRR